MEDEPRMLEATMTFVRADITEKPDGYPMPGITLLLDPVSTFEQAIEARNLIEAALTLAGWTELQSEMDFFAVLDPGAPRHNIPPNEKE